MTASSIPGPAAALRARPAGTPASASRITASMARGINRGNGWDPGTLYFTSPPDTDTMKWFSYFLIALFITGMALIAGCTQQVATPVPTTTPAAAPALNAIALTAADAPVNYTLTSSRAKTSDEVGSVAKKLGWESGYVVTYSGYPDDKMGETVITQTITTYPANRMDEIFGLIETNDKADKELVITDRASPGLGERSFAFSGTAVSQIVLRPKTDDPLSQGSLEGSFKQDVTEIGFFKGSTLEILKMEGANTDYEVLLELARTAYNKVP